MRMWIGASPSDPDPDERVPMPRSLTRLLSRLPGRDPREVCALGVVNRGGYLRTPAAAWLVVGTSVPVAVERHGWVSRDGDAPKRLSPSSPRRATCWRGSGGGRTPE